jgi:hypothetical protein
MKIIWANFQRIIELFTKNIVKKLLKIWSWDPGSGIRKKPIPDPGSRSQKAPNPGSRIRIRNTVIRDKPRFFPIPDPGSGSATLVMRLWMDRKITHCEIPVPMRKLRRFVCLLLQKFGKSWVRTQHNPTQWSLVFGNADRIRQQ